jgi:hypothetical protein
VVLVVILAGSIQDKARLQTLPMAAIPEIEAEPLRSQDYTALAARAAHNNLPRGDLDLTAIMTAAQMAAREDPVAPMMDSVVQTDSGQPTPAQLRRDST